MGGVVWSSINLANVLVEVSLTPMPAGRTLHVASGPHVSVAQLSMEHVARALGLSVPDALSSQILGGSIKKVDDHTYEISRAEVDYIWTNLKKVTKRIRIVPAFRGAVAEGFRLHITPNDFLYSRLGIQNGDVIKRINEFNWDDRSSLVYAGLRSASRFELEFVRNGTTVRNTYDVR